MNKKVLVLLIFLGITLPYVSYAQDEPPSIIALPNEIIPMPPDFISDDSGPSGEPAAPDEGLTPPGGTTPGDLPEDEFDDGADDGTTDDTQPGTTTGDSGGSSGGLRRTGGIVPSPGTDTTG